MSGLTDFDGLCGIIHLHAGDKQIRCHFKFEHEGPHSHADKGIVSGIFTHSVEEFTQKPLNEQDSTRNFPLQDPFTKTPKS